LLAFISVRRRSSVIRGLRAPRASCQRGAALWDPWPRGGRPYVPLCATRYYTSGTRRSRGTRAALRTQHA
jgi:hypothetical protein